MSRKRPAQDTIDLTGDDDDADLSSHDYSSTRFAKVPRYGAGRGSGYNSGAPSSSAGMGASQANPISFDEGDDGSQGVDATQGGYTGEEYGWGLYGLLPTKIVGVRFYKGVATVNEMVILRREPNNPYDSNAIQVINVQGEQIGHIPRVTAAKLAKYMGNRTLLLEGIITGRKGEYDCPIEIKVYGTDEPAARDQLIEQLRADKLPVGHAIDRRRKQQKAEKERQKLAAQAARAAKKNGGAVVGMGSQFVFDNANAQFAAGSSQGTALNPFDLDDIIDGSERINPRNVDSVVERFGVKEEDLAAMPKAPQPEALITELHPFQLQGLQWMLDKESPRLPAAGTKDVVQLWQRHPTMANAFINLATNFAQKEPPLSSGGILADDMGLGKTIQVISLIMADRALGRPSSAYSKATLILAPVSVMSNWSTQMAKHIKPEYALRVMFYHGTRKQPLNEKEISKYDVVISTYETVSSEWHSMRGTVAGKSGIFSVNWRRVVLDEGHNIRNPKAKRTVAVNNLQAQSRWALTGTPIINSLKDLYSLVRFLQPQGILKEFQIFNGAIIRPVMQGEANGNGILQLLMAGICLRRKKEMSFIDLRLPELSEYVHKINLLPHEQEKYDALETQAKGTLEIYRSKLGSRDSATDTYRHLLEVLLRMRQLCNHWKLISEERLDSIMKQIEAEGIVDLTEENKAALQSMLQLSIDSQEDCPICLETLDLPRDPIITKCAHIFCTPCLERVIETQHKCPMCRAELESLLATTVKPAKETAAAAPLTQEQIADKESLEKEASSKVTAMLSILHASSKDPTNKTVVFSQWTTFLDLLTPHLQGAGFKFTRIDGSMTALQRDAALETFDADPSTTILLASLSVASVGLNLTVANQVILVDSWWSPAIEDQAVDRVHRLGQKRETRVFRLVTEGSIEERVLGVQAEKRKLMAAAFGENGDQRRGKRKAGAGLADLERLLNSGSANGGAVAESSG